MRALFQHKHTGERIAVYIWDYTSETYTYLISRTIDGEYELLDGWFWKRI